MPFSKVGIKLPRARNFSSVSIAIFDDSDRGGVIKCPASVRITTNNGTVLADREHWNTCKPNALNTIVFDAAGASNSSAGTMTGPMFGNGTTGGSGGGTVVETDNLQITLFNEIMFGIAIPEIQIWVEANQGPRYEAEDALLGTFIGGFEGRQLGMNSTIEDGGVTLHAGAWAEIAGVRSPVGTGTGSMTVIGKGTGSVAVQMNWLVGNVTVTFAGDAVTEQNIEVPFLEGENYVTILRESGDPWIDAIIVGPAAANSTTK